MARVALALASISLPGDVILLISKDKLFRALKWQIQATHGTKGGQVVVLHEQFCARELLSALNTLVTKSGMSDNNPSDDNAEATPTEVGQYHIRKAEAQETFNCTECEKVFQTEKGMKIHRGYVFMFSKRALHLCAILSKIMKQYQKKASSFQRAHTPIPLPRAFL